MTPKRIGAAFLTRAILGAAAAWAFWPRAILVDLVTVQVAPLQLTVAADGVTKVRDPYKVTSPISGNLRRAEVAVGDSVLGGQTIVAVIEPATAAVLDSRARLQAEAAVDEAEAALDMARANLAQAEADLAHATAEYDRSSALAARGILAQHMLDDAQIAQDSAISAVTAARSSVDLQQAVLVRMQADLTYPADSARQPLDRGCCIEILAPTSGTVLSLESSSARFVLPGTSLMKIGDLSQMEVLVDLLSSDAIRVKPGAVATLERWGGDTAISAIVKRVEPAAYSRISALGIEEQRVRVQLDILDSSSMRAGLGDNFRVFVRIVIWQQDAVLQVPIGALFRNGDSWAVFRDVNGMATLTPVEIGRQSDVAAQVLAGLSDGESIVVYPGSKVTDGTRIEARTPL